MLETFIASQMVAVAATPLAVRVARRTGFLDHPTGYKAHAEPTPYLGGAVVLAGFMAGALVSGAFGEPGFGAVFLGAGFLWLVGTIDDRLLLGPRVRILAETLAAVLLWHSGLGWSLFPGELADLVVTVLWVVGVVNAFNLMDNLDGAAGTVAGASAAGIALLAAYEGPEVAAGLAVAVCGACAGFLVFNLWRPARIFLGDGGSMLLGFLVAALVMAVWRLNGMVGTAFLPAIMLAGLPILDMTLVIVSRLRVGVPVGKGRRDHTTHRLLPKLGSTWAVALVLGLAQGALSVVAIELMDAGRGTMAIGAGAAFLLGVVTIAVLETPFFSPYPASQPGATLMPTDGLRGRGDQRSSASSHSRERRSMSTPLNEGATSGRSIPRTDPGP